MELHGLIDGPAEAAGVEYLEGKAIAGILGGIEGEGGVVDASGVVDDGEGAVFRADHLGEAAGLEGAWHEHEIGSGVAEAGEGLGEVGDGDAIVEAVDIYDVVEVVLVGSVGDDGDLEVFGGVIGDDVVEDFGEELGAFLDGIEAGGPEEEGGVGVLAEAEAFLEGEFIGALAGGVIVGGVVLCEGVVGGGVVVCVGGVEDSGGAAGVGFGAEFVADGIGDEVVVAVYDFAEEGGGDGVYVVGGEDAGGELIDAVPGACFVVGAWGFFKVEVVPKFGAIDPAVFDFIEGEVLGVDVVDGEEGFDASGACDGGDEAGHPIVAVDEVRLDAGDDVGGEFALEGEGHAGVVAGLVDFVAVVEGVVFGEVDAPLLELF